MARIKPRKPAAPPIDLDAIDAQLERELETDRGFAILAATLLEEALENLIRATIPIPGDDKAAREALNGMFFDANGAFSSLYQKIEFAYVYGAVSAEHRSLMHCIRNIRNLFAHNQHHTFDDPDVLKAILHAYGPMVDLHASLFTKGDKRAVERRRQHRRAAFQSLLPRIQFAELFRACYSLVTSEVQSFPLLSVPFRPYEIAKTAYRSYIVKPED